MDGLTVVLIWLVAGLATGWAANRKGYSGWIWFGFGVLLWPVALPWALLMGPNITTRRRCPHCAEWISRDAMGCSACGGKVDPEPPAFISYAP